MKLFGKEYKLVKFEAHHEVRALYNEQFAKGMHGRDAVHRKLRPIGNALSTVNAAAKVAVVSTVARVHGFLHW